MGYWENTTYVKAEDPSAIIATMKRLFSEEGMQLVPQPSPRERCEYEPMQYAPALENDLWAVAVFPGKPGWSVIKSAPLELLSEFAPNESRPRISHLCQTLGTSAFQFNVYDGAAVLLCEVEGSGELHVSGMADFNRDPTSWHGMVLDEDAYEPRFQVLPFQEMLSGAYGGDQMASVLAGEFGGLNASCCDNLTSVDSLIGNLDVEAPGGAVAYFSWSGPSRVRTPPCSFADYRATKRPRSNKVSQEGDLRARVARQMSKLEMPKRVLPGTQGVGLLPIDRSQNLEFPTAFRPDLIKDELPWGELRDWLLSRGAVASERFTANPNPFAPENQAEEILGGYLERYDLKGAEQGVVRFSYLHITHSPLLIEDESGRNLSREVISAYELSSSIDPNCCIFDGEAQLLHDPVSFLSH